MKKQLLLIGGGHAHMITLARLETFVNKGYGVTVIQPSDYHYYSGMGPGMLGGTYQPEDIRFHTRRQVEEKGGRFIHAKAYRIDPHKQVVLLEDSDEAITYDVLSCNAGSFVPKTLWDEEDENIFTVKPIEQLLLAQRTVRARAMEKPITVAVVGSGPSAVEVAGNLHQLCKAGDMNPVKIKLFAGKRFLSGRPVKVQRLARSILERKGVEIHEGGYVEKIGAGSVILKNGERYSADIIFPAIGVKPSAIFARSGLPIGPDGGLQVNEYLQSIRYPNIYGGGDCIFFQDQPLDKVGVYAVRQNEVLYQNLMASLDGRGPKKFEPGGAYLLIYNLGDGVGILSKWSVTFSGKIAFVIKDYIDRRFITAFQQK